MQNVRYFAKTISILSFAPQRISWLFDNKVSHIKRSKQVGEVCESRESVKSASRNYINSGVIKLITAIMSSCLSGQQLSHIVELLSDKSLESIPLEALCSRQAIVFSVCNLHVHSVWLIRDFDFNFSTENLLFLTEFHYWHLLDISYFVLV